MLLREYLTTQTTFTAFAKSFGVTQPSVTFWVQKGVPPKHVIPVCAATHWRCTPHELRPDLYPLPSDALPPANQNEPPWHLYGGY